MSIFTRVLSSAALPLVGVFTSSEFWNLYRRYSRDTQSLFDPAEESTLSRIKDLVEHCYSSVEFYRDRMDRLGLRPSAIRSLADFSLIPPITKSEVAQNFPDRITANPKPFRPWRYVSTSGTIDRLTAIQDFRKRDYVRCTQLLALNSATGYTPGRRYLELPPDVCRNVCGARDSMDPPLATYVWENLGKFRRPEVISDLKGLVETQIVYCRKQLPSYGSDGLVQKPEIWDNYLREFTEFQPHVAKALPAYLYALACHARRTGWRPPAIKGGLMPMGGSVSAVMKRRIEQAFGTLVHEDYGCAEIGALGAECGHQNGVHPFSAFIHLEVEVDGRPARPGELGSVLVTDLFSYAMPFLRYEIGDVAVKSVGRCACGLESERITIMGRAADCLPGPDGELIPPDRILDAILVFPDVFAFQAELVGPEALRVDVVPADKSVNLRRIEDSLHSLLGSRIQIRSRVAPTILSEAGGKFRFVKNLAGVGRSLHVTRA